MLKHNIATESTESTTRGAKKPVRAKILPSSHGANLRMMEPHGEDIT